MFLLPQRELMGCQREGPKLFFNISPGLIGCTELTVLMGERGRQMSVRC